MDMQDLTRSIRDYYARCQQRYEEARPLILMALRDGNVTKVTVAYSGSGDSGCVDDISTEPKNADLSVTIVLDSKPLPLSVLLEEYVYDALTIHHGGWENNDGASGELVWNIETDTATLNHSSYYTESDFTETAL